MTNEEERRLAGARGLAVVGDEFVHGFDADAGLAGRGDGELEDGGAGGGVGGEFGEGDFGDGFLLRLHDAGEGDVAGLVEA